MGNCRKAEQIFNKCVFTHLNLEKKIPGVPEDKQIHLQEKKIYNGFGTDDSLVKEYLKKQEQPAKN